jgi:hypothetical protein
MGDKRLNMYLIMQCSARLHTIDTALPARYGRSLDHTKYNNNNVRGKDGISRWIPGRLPVEVKPAGTATRPDHTRRDRSLHII